jgi:hypothetical protein
MSWISEGMDQLIVGISKARISPPGQFGVPSMNLALACFACYLAVSTDFIEIGLRQCKLGLPFQKLRDIRKPLLSSSSVIPEIGHRENLGFRIGPKISL